MLVYGFGADVIEEPVGEIHVWFDKWNDKVWYTTLYNKDGDTIGESASSHRKTWAKNEADAMAENLRRAEHSDPTVKVFTRDGVYNG